MYYAILMVANKTIVVSEITKNNLAELKDYPRETFDDLIKKMIEVYKQKGLRRKDCRLPLNR